MALTAAIDLTVKKPDFKSMKSEIRELTVAAQQAVMQFGEFSPEAIRAEQALAQARDRMDDFNDRVAAVNPDKFAQINTVVQGVARGFQAAQGAMALFGSESEDLQKTMVKLQGAMALAEGLEGLGKVQQQFSAIAGNIKGNVLKAFQALGKMSTLAFGAIGIALTLIIANFDKLKNAILGLIPGLKTIANFVGNLVQRFTDFVGITSAAERALDKLNKTTEKSNEQLDREIALLQARGDQVGVFNKQRQKLENDLAKARANYGKNNEENWGKIILDTKNALEVLKIEEQNFNKDQAKARKDANDARAKEAKEANDRLNAENLKKEEKYFEGLEGIQRKGITTASLLRYQARTEADDLIDKARADEAAKVKKAADEEILAAKQVYDAKIGFARATVDGLSSLNTILTTEEKKREQIAKGIALVEIAIDSAVAFSSLNAESAKASAQAASILGPATPIFTAAYYAQGVARILANVARAKQLLSGGSASKGGSQPQTTNIQGIQQSVPQVSSTLPQVSGFEQRVFVTEGDISRTQARVGNTKRVSVVK
jgi:hypothetical protein